MESGNDCAECGGSSLGPSHLPPLVALMTGAKLSDTDFSESVPLGALRRVSAGPF